MSYEDDVKHCKDCCCARSWKALGIAEYTGKSIPEHITGIVKALRETLEYARQTMPASEFAEAMELVRSTPPKRDENG